MGVKQKDNLWEELQKVILAYDIIIFVPHGVRKIADVLQKYNNIEKRKIFLIFGPDEIYKPAAAEDVIQMDADRCNDLYKLYRTYEFSDKFRMISEDGNFGTIWNYVKTGLLTAEEAVTALLH